MEYRIQGDRIRALREGMGLSQSELAALIVRDLPGVNQSQISQVERGAAGLRAESLAVIARTLETSTDYLLGLTDDPTQRDRMGNAVILVESVPERRELLQRLFAAIGNLPPELRDRYVETLVVLYRGIAAAAANERGQETLRQRGYGGDLPSIQP